MVSPAPDPEIRIELSPDFHDLLHRLGSPYCWSTGGPLRHLRHHFAYRSALHPHRLRVRFRCVVLRRHTPETWRTRERLGGPVTKRTVLCAHCGALLPEEADGLGAWPRD